MSFGNLSMEDVSFNALNNPDGFRQQASICNAIDPSLQSVDTTAQRFEEQLGSDLMMQQYFDRTQTPSYCLSSQLPGTAFVPLPSDFAYSPYTMRHGHQPTPLSPPYSTTSCPLSPTTEYGSPPGPSTPPDMTNNPPLFSGMVSEAFQDYHPALSHQGVALPSASQCVNLATISPSHYAEPDGYDNNVATKFSLDRDLVSNNSYRGESPTPPLPFSHPSRPSDTRHSAENKVPLFPSPSLPYPNFGLDQEWTGPVEDTIKSSSPCHNIDVKIQLPKVRRPPRNKRPAKASTPRSKVVKKRSPIKPDLMEHTTPSSNSNRRMVLPSHSIASTKCQLCNLPPFKDGNTLQKHIKTKHDKRFVCVFHFAGCDGSFPNKNEWKRHINSQHIASKYWACAKATCPELRGSKFRRKDLFTQHYKRMHLGCSGNKNQTLSPEKEVELKKAQGIAETKRCNLPMYMRCPVMGCSHEFRGAKAWDSRLEHIGKHTEANGDEPVQFGDDETLTAWASSEDAAVLKHTAAGWRLCNPIPGKGPKSDEDETEVDAEGEGSV